MPPGEVLAPGERLDIGVTAQSPKAHFATDAVVGLRRPQVTFAEACRVDDGVMG